jgi:hypothetical protein
MGIMKSLLTMLRGKTWTDLALGVVCFGLVFQYAYFGGRLSMPLIEPIIYWALIIALLGLPKLSALPTRTPFWGLMLWIGLGGVWVMLLLATAQWGAEDGNDVRILLLPMICGLIFLWEVGWTPEKVMRFLSVAMVLSAIIAILMTISGTWDPPFTIVSHKELWNPISEIGSRVAVGFFKNSNVFAAFLFWPMLYLASALRVQVTGRNAMYWLAFLVCAIGLMLSLARGVWIGMAAALLWAAWLARRPRPRSVALGIGGWVVAGVSLFFVAWLLAPHDGFFLSLGFRQEFWKITLAYYRQNPCILWGGAIGCAQTGVGSIFQSIPDDPHNLFFYMLSHYGAAGFLLMVGTLVYLVWHGWRRYQMDRMSQAGFSRFLWAGWLAFVWMTLLDSYFTTLEYRVLFFILAAITIKQMDEWPERSAERHGKNNRDISLTGSSSGPPDLPVNPIHTDGTYRT